MRSLMLRDLLESSTDPRRVSSFLELLSVELAESLLVESVLEMLESQGVVQNDRV